MTRKDTIIIAVFVNAALLIALFTSAIVREEKVTPLPVKKEIAEAVPVKVPEQKPVVAVKEIAKEEKPKPNIDFAKELEAITKAAAKGKAEKVVPMTAGNQVKVQKGDVLEKIARRHGCSVGALMEYNQLKSNVLQIGQVLKIPGNQAVSSSKDNFYTVKQGDNPWAIAVKNHMKLEDLLKLNDLNEEKARRLRPGDKLRIE